MFRDMLNQLAAGQALDSSALEAVITDIAQDVLTDAQIAGFLMALRIKGISATELIAITKAMRKQAIPVNPRVTEPLLDTCGTGGGLSTFNISTASAFVCAAAGIPVAKHGSRSLSSLCGSADVLEALGIQLTLPVRAIEQQIEQIGIGFLHAPDFHPVMRRLLPVEASLGIKTIFYTLIGPLINPAQATRHLLGLYLPELQTLTASVLPELDYRDVMLVHGVDGLDEISLLGATTIVQFAQGAMHTYQISPEQFGLQRCTLDQIRSQVPLVSADLIRQIFSGKLQGPHRDAVLINSAGGLLLCGRVADFGEGISLAADLLDQGLVAAKLEQLVQMSQDQHSQAHLPSMPQPPVMSGVSEPQAEWSAAFAALQQSEQNKRARLNTLIETLPDLIWLEDNDGRLVNCNSRFERFVGLPEAELKGLRCEDVLPAPVAAQLNSAATAARQQQRPVLSQQWVTYLGDGHQEYVDIIHTPFFNQHQQLDGVIGIARDVTSFKNNEDELLRHRDQLELLVGERTRELSTVITQLRSAQLQLVEAEKIAALGTIIAGLSHEMNTPVGNLLTLGSALDSELKRLSTELEQGLLSKTGLQQFISHTAEMLVLMQRSAQRTADLINDFKQLSAEQIAEQRKPFLLSDLLHSCLHEYQPLLQQAQISLDWHCEPQLHCDSFPAAVSQILANLLKNVLKHAFVLDKVPAQPRQLQIWTESEAEKLTLYCRDNGVGMDALALVRIFNPFFTSSMSRGAGIGLAVSKRLALSVLGGDLTVSATPGQGCCFALQMPLRAPGYRGTSAVATSG